MLGFKQKNGGYQSLYSTSQVQLFTVWQWRVNSANWKKVEW